jgi:methyltransferase
VFDNKSTSSDDAEATKFENEDSNGNGAQFLVRILRYLETPQYLRKQLFPMHKSLKYVVCKLLIDIFLLNIIVVLYLLVKFV